MKLNSGKEVRREIERRSLRVTEFISHPRGIRVNVVDRLGRPSTLRVDKKKRSDPVG